MKIDTFKLLTVAGLLLAGGGRLLQAQSYSVNWHVISGGGATSTNGSLSLTGTVGQLGPGTSSGGGFTMKSGFWNLSTGVPIVGVPVLTITLISPGTAAVSWPLPVTGFTLQSTSNLGTSNWLNYAGIVISNSVTISPTTGNVYYRLFKP
jgi:hypothetical protein